MLLTDIKDKISLSKKPWTLIVLSGGSGTGKTTVANLLAKDPNITKLITSTTRSPRPGEKHGKDYYFITKEVFIEELNKGKLLEYTIYDRNYYGLHKKVIDLILGKQQKHGVISVDTKGMKSLKDYCQVKGYKILTFLLKVRTGQETIIERMESRGATQKEITSRLDFEKKESQIAKKYDYTFTTDELCPEEIVWEIKKITIMLSQRHQ